MISFLLSVTAKYFLFLNTENMLTNYTQLKIKKKRRRRRKEKMKERSKAAAIQK
jgi:hypothetical protein